MTIEAIGVPSLGVADSAAAHSALQAAPGEFTSPGISAVGVPSLGVADSAAAHSARQAAPGEFTSPGISAVGVRPKDAQAFWQDKVPMGAKEYAALEDEARARGFFVGGLAKGDLLDAIHQSLGTARAEGTSFAAWKKGLRPQLEKDGWSGDNPHRLETIFRTNMQSAYMAGRYTQMQKTVALRPYWQMSGVNDSRTRPSHAALHGVVYPADHDFWDTYYPPNGFRCRCTVKSLSARQVESRGLKVETEVDHLREHPDFGLVNTRPAFGFDRNVGKDWWAGVRPLADSEKHPEAWAEADKHAPQGERPQPVTSYTELGRELERTCGGFMSHGKPVSVEFTASKSYGMATYSDGRLMISTAVHDTLRGPFNAAKELKNAWNALATGRPLTWNQEYSVECLWHEIMHNRQVPERSLKPSDKSGMLMETVNQWVARRSYQDFLGKFGAVPKHQVDILKNGLGFWTFVRNFDALLGKAGIKDGDILHSMRTMVEGKPRDSYEIHLLAMLGKKNSLLSAGKLQRAFRELDLSDKGFKELLDTFVKQ